jgi:hypothetical protein
MQCSQFMARSCDDIRAASTIPRLDFLGDSRSSFGMTFVKGQRTGEEPVNYGRRLAEFAAGYVE